MKTVVVAHFHSVIAYPPVINLIEGLLDNNVKTILISMDTNLLPDKVANDDRFTCYELKNKQTDNIIESIRQKYELKTCSKFIVAKAMKEADILWTTTDFTVRWLGDTVKKYKHIMQLMELIEYYPMYPRIFKWLPLRFPIEKIARKAWKVVVPEINRAYIQKTWWNLRETPIILPNKPYQISDNVSITDNTIKEKLAIIKKEKRKIILYSGILWFDRDFSEVMKSIEKISDEYAFYIIGAVPEAYEKEFKLLLQRYKNVIYLGYFRAPLHIQFYKYAYIGLLPYKAGKINGYVTHISELNALYCAPNKIFEYAGMGIPMIGSNVMGLLYPFEKYNMGVCCDKFDEKNFINAVNIVEKDHKSMQRGCREFYDSINLKEIIRSIIFS